MTQYYTDATAGKLPQVAFVESDPFGDVNHESDEHPPANVQVGQKFTHDVINGARQEPELVVVGDVPHLRRARRLLRPRRAARRAASPTTSRRCSSPATRPAPSTATGSGCPTIVVSPYAKKHFVSHTVYDHTSILRFIETRFGLPTLTKRDKAADPMLGMFNFTKMSNPKPSCSRAPVDPAGKAACIALHPPS